MNKTQVYVIHHGKENYPLVQNTITTPILAGSEQDEGEFGWRIALRETTGKNITKKHHLYSEFTVYYWIWQNVLLNSDIENIGIFHY